MHLEELMLRGDQRLTIVFSEPLLTGPRAVATIHCDIHESAGSREHPLLMALIEQIKGKCSGVVAAVEESIFFAVLTCTITQADAETLVEKALRQIGA